MGRRKYTPEHYKAMFKLWNEGLSVEEIRLKLEMPRGSSDVVSKFLKQKRIPTDDIKLRGIKQTGLKHRTSGKVLHKRGYVAVPAPSWFTGGDQRAGRYQAYEHQVVYCEANRLTSVPHGYVIHHINHDSTDNRLENLVLLTRKEHSDIHHKDLREYIQWLEEQVTKPYPKGIPRITWQ